MIVLSLGLAAPGHYVDPDGLEACVVAKSTELATQSTEPADTIVRVAFNRCEHKLPYEQRMLRAQAAVDGYSRSSDMYVARESEKRQVRTTDSALDAILTARAPKP